MTARPSKPRLLLFAFGDFAFNLYWQSIMLFLLFYYTDALNLPIGIAATTYMVASVWDGIANFVAGVLVDRRREGTHYGALLVGGALPLGICFTLTYLPPAVQGGWAIASILGAHLLFRTAYAGVNVPYLAMSARITVASCSLRASEWAANATASSWPSVAVTAAPPLAATMLGRPRPQPSSTTLVPGRGGCLARARARISALCQRRAQYGIGRAAAPSSSLSASQSSGRTM